ncbi:MAG: alkaline phosphatase family protein [Mycobacterium sp.]|nr:alkaline phosphatase family protein [Mycobacterium sp.]
MLLGKRTAVAAIALAIGSIAAIPPATATVSTTGTQTWASAAITPTGTPIKHLVVIYQENHSFDNYFGTYPDAPNPPGEPAFHAAPHTPTVDGLTPALLNDNPNLANPFRLDRSQEITCDNNHGYTAMQKAYDNGKLDKFVQEVGPTGPGCSPTLTMGHYDGNTVTALWNYAQHFAMSDNSFADTYGPSTPQALNLISGQTHGAVPTGPTPNVVNGTLVTNLKPANDDCDASGNAPVKMSMTGRNVGDLLNARQVTWGWFTGGFERTAVVDGKAICDATTTNIAGTTENAYDAGWNNPFQYYASTNNAHHVPPTSTAMIGSQDQANHQYGLTNFWAAADSGNLPAVSFLKAPVAQQGHPTSSSPLDEQRFLVDTINQLEALPSWKNTAVIITWDESDGWYDHAKPPTVNDSQSTVDALTGPGQCGTETPILGYQDRCGYGPRIPEMVISPYSKVNFVSHALTAQSVILRFIEQNWHLGHIGDGSFDVRSGNIDSMFDFGRPTAKPLFLDPATGEPTAPPASS